MTARATWRSLALLVVVAGLAGCSGGATGEPLASGAGATAGPTAAVSAAPSESAEPAAPEAPQDWPAALPVPQAASLLTLMISPDGTALNSVWSSDGSIAEADEAYRAALTSAGFTEDYTTAADDMVSTDLSGNGLTVNVVTAVAGGQTTLLVNASRE